MAVATYLGKRTLAGALSLIAFKVPYSRAHELTEAQHINEIGTLYEGYLKSNGAHQPTASLPESALVKSAS